MEKKTQLPSIVYKAPCLLRPAQLSVLILQSPAFVHQAPSTLAITLFLEHIQPAPTGGPFHLRFPLGWIVAVLLGSLVGQELLFLLESLEHLLSHCSHLCQICLWIQEALGAPTRNKMIGEAFLQEYHNKKVLWYGSPNYGNCDSHVVQFCETSFPTHKNYVA